MADPFLALITPLTGQPPGIWGGAPSYPDQGLPPPQPHPGHPIVIPPDAIAPGLPSHPIYLPPVIWPSPGHPAHPIVLPPGSIGPGVPTHPIVLPPPAHPSHPIVIPPGSIAPGVPSHPIVLPPVGIWPPPGYPDHSLPGPQPEPGHPIVLPPGGAPIEPPTTLPPPAGHEDEIVVMVYRPGQGWSGASYDVVPDQGLPKPTPHG